MHFHTMCCAVNRLLSIRRAPPSFPSNACTLVCVCRFHKLCCHLHRIKDCLSENQRQLFAALPCLPYLPSFLPPTGATSNPPMTRTPTSNMLGPFEMRSRSNNRTMHMADKSNSRSAGHIWPGFQLSGCWSHSYYNSRYAHDNCCADP